MLNALFPSRTLSLVSILSSAILLPLISGLSGCWASASASTLILPSMLKLTQTSLSQAPTETSENSLAPTARYANGEDVDLAEIIAEWRGYYTDVPVYLCVCQDGSCNQTQQWPYREYDRYQFSVALGPNNGQSTEENGFNCFDISDGSQPSDPRDFSTALATSGTDSDGANSDDSTATSDSTTRPAQPDIDDSPVTAPVAPPAAAASAAATSSAAAANSDIPTSDIPTATTINNGADIQLDWPSGRSDVLNVTSAGRAWNINILNALDCESLSAVSEKTMSAQRIVGSPAVDQITGYVAVPVLLDTCVDTDQMAVFVVDPTEGGAYELYRTQLPSVRGLAASQDVVFPNESSSYAYSTIVEMRYWDSTLLVRQADASGATVISIFRPGSTPAGTYAGCGVVSEGEGATALCNQ